MSDSTHNVPSHGKATKAERNAAGLAEAITTGKLETTSAPADPPSKMLALLEERHAGNHRYLESLRSVADDGMTQADVLLLAHALYLEVLLEMDSGELDAAPGYRIAVQLLEQLRKGASEREQRLPSLLQIDVSVTVGDDEVSARGSGLVVG